MNMANGTSGSIKFGKCFFEKFGVLLASEVGPCSTQLAVFIAAMAAA